MWKELFSAIKNLDFQQVQRILGNLDVMTLLTDPYMIGAIVLISIVMLVRGMQKGLVTFLSIPALLVIFEKTVQGDMNLETSGHKILIFAGGFVGIAAINVYVHFVRS